MQGLAKQSDKYMELPSTFQIGWEVCLQFGESNPIIRHCHVTKVLFTRDKVFYDIQVQIREPGETPDGYLPMCIGHTRIHSVDSAFVKNYSYGLEPKGGLCPEWNSRKEYPDTNRLVECRYKNIDQLNFLARVKWGIEWFDEQGKPIRDAVQFEWREIKRS